MCDRAQQRLLAAVEADQVLDVGVHELVVGDAGAERVDHTERAGAQRRREQPAGGAVEARVVGPAVDDVDGLAGVEQPVAAERELAVRDHGHAEVAGEHAVLPPGAVERPVGEHDDVRVGARGLGRGGEERLAQQRGRVGDRAHLERGAEGQGRLDLLARGHRVGDAAGGPGVVLEHEQAAVAPADDVEPGDPDPAVGRRRVGGGGGLEVARAAHHFERDHALADRPARAVHVGHEAVERVHALGEPGAQGLPLGRRDHARHGIDAEQLALGAAEAHVVALEPGPHAGRQASGIAGQRAHHGLGVGARRPVRQQRLVPVRGRGVRGRSLLVRGIRHLTSVPDGTARNRLHSVPKHSGKLRPAVERNGSCSAR